ncbi:MAG: HDOD domain-containing protein, partial [Rhodothermales bacterium]|nr:HDOD domain-containing protein [Rhodothermales bacterium]
LAAAHALAERPAALSVRRVVALVERDPLIVAQLLQQANAAYYGLRHRVSSVERAVVLLGPVAVVGQIVGMGMLRLRPVADGPAGPLFLRVVQHSVATAYLARYLLCALPRALRPNGPDGAPALPPPPLREGAYTAGLLHDLGKLLLVYNAAAAAAAFYEADALAAHVTVGDPREMERLLFGCDHAEAGSYAALRLGLPDPLAHVIASHHAPARAQGSEGRLVRAIAAADAAAAAFGYGEPAACRDAGRDGPCYDGAALAGAAAWTLLAERDFPGHTPAALAAALRPQAGALRAPVGAAVAARA